MAILKLALNIKSKVQSQEMRKQRLLQKQIQVRNLHQRNQQTFTKFGENFTKVKMIVMKKTDYC